MIRARVLMILAAILPVGVYAEGESAKPAMPEAAVAVPAAAPAPTAATNAPQPAAAAAAAPPSAPIAAEKLPIEKQSVRYVLNNLKPAGITQYSFPGESKLRQYLHFQNVQGQHYIIYEESTNLEPLREVANLRQAMVNPEPLFRVELECRQKAFCTGECKNMYYQMTNITKANANAVNPNEPNECRLLSFTNEKPGGDRNLASSVGNP